MHESNARHAEEIAGFNFAQANREADFNQRVAGVQQQWSNYYAQLLLRQGQVQQKAYHQAAASREAHGQEPSLAWRKASGKSSARNVPGRP